MKVTALYQFQADPHRARSACTLSPLQEYLPHNTGILVFFFEAWIVQGWQEAWVVQGRQRAFP